MLALCRWREESLLCFLSGDQAQAVPLLWQEAPAQQQRPGNGVELGRRQVSRQQLPLTASAGPSTPPFLSWGGTSQFLFEDCSRESEWKCPWLKAEVRRSHTNGRRAGDNDQQSEGLQGHQLFKKSTGGWGVWGEGGLMGQKLQLWCSSVCVKVHLLSFYQLGNRLIFIITN